MKKKKIRTFTVDDETYKKLMELFKRCEVEKSISFVVDKVLKELFECLEALEKRYNESSEYSVPMSYVIDTVLRDRFVQLDEYFDEKIPETERIPGTIVLNEIQSRYDAEKMKVPLFYANAVKSGKFALSKDKKYIISLEDGIKYCLNDSGFVEEYRDE
jgi:hypothetical protein